MLQHVSSSSGPILIPSPAGVSLQRAVTSKRRMDKVAPIRVHVCREGEALVSDTRIPVANTHTWNTHRQPACEDETCKAMPRSFTAVLKALQGLAPTVPSLSSMFQANCTAYHSLTCPRGPISKPLLRLFPPSEMPPSFSISCPTLPDPSQTPPPPGSLSRWITLTEHILPHSTKPLPLGTSPPTALSAFCPDSGSSVLLSRFLHWGVHGPSSRAGTGCPGTEPCPQCKH